jgi:RNAse (barnase) inhibitor barstar
MAWQVAVILDTETNLNVGIGLMPIWARATPEREAYPLEWREQWNAMWSPDPGFTLITTPHAGDLIEQAANTLPTVSEHHPNLFCVHLFGLPQSDRLNTALGELGYRPATISMDSGQTFVRSFEKFARELVLDASGWNLKSGWYWVQDLYSAFFLAVGAPEWHGRNFDALNDSIAGEGINKIEVPYRVVIRNAPHKNEMVKQVLGEFGELFHHLQSAGCPVSFSVET